MFAFRTLDVFTQQPFGGNPLCVFPEARNIPESLYLSIAREMNLSETVFILPGDTPAEYTLRIFTPARELAFAGHPIVGTAAALADILDRAVALYRDRLARWLAARFSVRGSGLSREQLRRQRVRAILRIAEDGTVADFEVIDSGNAAFDQGARAALESVRGLPLPIPPDHYPTAIPREIHVSFVCKESQCD